MPKESLTTDTKLVLGTESTVMLDARSDIYSATAKKADGPRGGVLPSAITLAAGGGIISFPKVIGKASCVAAEGTNADGGDCAGGNTDLESLGKLSGIKHHKRTMFLVGVFVGAKLPAKAPAILDFSDEAKGTKFAKLEPALGQVFFIGDGKPGEPAGDTHDFVIPKGATRLYLGYADGANFQGSPSSYDDNVGGLVCDRPAAQVARMSGSGGVSRGGLATPRTRDPRTLVPGHTAAYVAECVQESPRKNTALNVTVVNDRW